VTGNYTFFTASDDDSELWLSPTSSALDKRLIAYNSLWTSYKDWDAKDEQRSRAIPLVAGEAYYIEALLKEQGGADHMTIAWSYEETVDLQKVEIGDGVLSSWTFQDGVYQVSVDSGDITKTSDSFSFCSREWTGDGEFVVRVTEMNNPGNWGKAGLMIREGDGAGARHALVMRSSHGAMRFLARDEVDGSTESTSTHIKDGPPITAEWLRLRREGNLIEGYIGNADGEWTYIGEVTLAGLGDTVLVGMASSSNSAEAPFSATFESFSASPFQPVESIPVEFLTPYTIDPLDTDDNSLPDDWEDQYPIAGTAYEQSEFGDPDGDFMTNLQESQLGTDPNTPTPIPGNWYRESWFNIYNYDVADLVAGGEFYQMPDATYVESTMSFRPVYYEGGRARGYLTAPETGTYNFWISCRGSMELWISTNEEKYRTRRVAWMGGDSGTGHGLTSTADNLWDHFVCQTGEVELEAGQEYFVEILSQTGHVGSLLHLSLAWARPGGDRQYIPSCYLSSYAQEAEDGDDDCLPDAWEIEYGLDETDNGAGDWTLQGERGDFDSDGLSNREEYLLGTDPGNWDTDGDGLSDFAESSQFGTDPTVSDVTAQSVVYTVSPSSVSGLGSSWVETGNGIVGSSFRGTGSWNFEVPSDGFWLLQIGGNLRGELRLDEELPIHVGIDGVDIGRETMEFRNSQAGSLLVLSPRLTQGAHTLELFIDNYTARRTLEITTIQVLQPGGLDADGNGLADWADAKLEDRSQLFDHTTYSHVSPAFVEGIASSPSLVDLTVITRSGEQNREQWYNDDQWDSMLPGFQTRLDSYETNLQAQMREGNGRMEGYQISHYPGPGHHKWFSPVELARNEAIGYVAQFENLGTSANGIIVWQPRNVMDGGSIDIAVGAELLLGAWVQLWDWQTVTLTVNGQSYSFPSAKTHVELFDTAGTYVVTASHPSGQTGSLTVNVRDADLEDDIALGEMRFLDVSLPGVDADLTLDSGDEIGFSSLSERSAGGSKLEMAGIFPGIHRTGVRLSDTGPLLDQEEIHVVGVSEALRNDTVVSTPLEDDNDTYYVQSPLLVTNLPDDGAYVKITIFAGGVTFTDGTTVRELDNDDLDEWGIYNLELLMPKERLGAPCHYIAVYNKDDVRIWRSTN
ncbi:MAG: hypothetical protein ACQKBU_11350, partial [Verrucomicrobiales bacterium]